MAAESPERPTVVKVKYLHSKTAAWVARARILGSATAEVAGAGKAPAPVRPGDLVAAGPAPVLEERPAGDQLFGDVDAGARRPSSSP